ncbi:hypothetical protein [Paenibacillus sp. IHBB 3054]|uniref:beta-xylosidase family glycoside hydrolase n=1 Tax=Paenibacillus sp. IHBB 3054 TaxID=3425689 RepID=UPI003F668534
MARKGQNPYAADWSLAERPGWLTLRGSNVTLDDRNSPTFIGRRQQHLDCRVSALLEFHPIHDGEKAGMTVIMNDQFHYEIALSCKNGRHVVMLRRRIGAFMRTEEVIEYSGEHIILER